MTILITIVVYLSAGFYFGVRFIKRNNQAKRDLRVFEMLHPYEEFENELVIALVEKGIPLGKARANVRRRKMIADNYKVTSEHLSHKTLNVIGFLTSMFLFPFMIPSKK